MPRYGIKVWSKDVLKNPDFFNEAAVAVKNGTFGYIELFAIPDRKSTRLNSSHDRQSRMPSSA